MKLYSEIEGGFEKALEIFTRNTAEKIVPVKSKIVVTSMPELMKFVDLDSEMARPQHLRKLRLSRSRGRTAGAYSVPLPHPRS